MDIDFSIALDYIPHLFKAALYTILIVVVSQACGTFIGFFLALGRISPLPWLKWSVWFYVWIFRGTPLLLQLFFVYYAAPAFGLTLDAVPSALIAMTASSAGYNCEIIRSGLQAVHHGQIEAARAVGMGYGRIVQKVIVPQAVRIVIPPYMTNFITHTKNSSLASVITVPELMLTAQMIYSSTYRAIEILTVAGLIYLAMTSALTWIQLGMEHRTNYEDRGLSRRRRRRLLLDSPPNGTPAQA